MMVITAQRGGTFRETYSIAKSYTETRKNHGASELLDEIVSSKPEIDHKRYHTYDELKQHTLQMLRDAVALLDGKATADEVEAYKHFTVASPSASPRPITSAATRTTSATPSALRSTRSPPLSASPPPDGCATSPSAWTDEPLRAELLALAEADQAFRRMPPSRMTHAESRECCGDLLQMDTRATRASHGAHAVTGDRASNWADSSAATVSSSTRSRRHSRLAASCSTQTTRTTSSAVPSARCAATPSAASSQRGIRKASVYTAATAYARCSPIRACVNLTIQPTDPGLRQDERFTEWRMATLLRSSTRATPAHWLN